MDHPENSLPPWKIKSGLQANLVKECGALANAWDASFLAEVRRAVS